MTKGLTSLDWDAENNVGSSNDSLHGTLEPATLGTMELALDVIPTPERALFELLDELPKHESFHQVDMLVEGLRTLSPRRLEKLLADCRSIKVKRLFFFFADRHQHAWVKRIDRSKVDLGTGKRMLVKGGRLDPVYQITVPDDLYAPR